MIKVWDSKDLEGIGEGKGWLRGRDLNPRPLGYELTYNQEFQTFSDTYGNAK